MGKQIIVTVGGEGHTLTEDEALDLVVALFVGLEVTSTAVLTEATRRISRKRERDRIVELTRERARLIRDYGNGENPRWNDHWALLTSHADEIEEGITIEEIRTRGEKG